MTQMMTRTTSRKTREMHNHHMDSTIWNDLTFCDNDIVVANYGKSGSAGRG